MVGTIQFGELIQFIQNFADLARPLVPGHSQVIMMVSWKRELFTLLLVTCKALKIAFFRDKCHKLGGVSQMS